MSMLLLLVVLICVCLVSCDSQPKTIFLLGGQSNMSGRGGVNNNTHVWDGIIPPECQPNPSILKLDVNLKWVEAREPLHKDIDVLDRAEKVTHGIGPGIPFAHEILKMRPNFGSIGLVPCAHQRSHIHEWQRGTKFYSLMMERAKVSIQNGAVIGGLVWWQGGADAGNQKQVDSFYNDTIKFFNDVRADLKSPELPILQVLIGKETSKSKPLTNEIRLVQHTIHLANLKSVESAQLPLEPDHVHLTTQGQVILGKKLARKYLSF